MKADVATKRVAAPAVRSTAMIAIAALTGCLLWSYWPTLVELREFWSRNQDYSVGQLVPLVALYLVWRERAALWAQRVRPCWWGAGLIGLAESLRLASVYYGYASGERCALLLAIAGVVLLAAGWRIFWRLKWVLLFLTLMVPLPARLHESIALPLQHKATEMAVFTLELLGFYVLREGNVLHLNEQTTVAVTEACSGLRMLTAFIFVAAVLVFLIKRPLWQRITLLASSVPIAVLSNAIRIITTAIFVHYAHNPVLGSTFHDMAGLAMMPLGLLMSLGLLQLLALLTAVDPPLARTALKGCPP